MRSFFYTALGVSATLAPVALASTSYFNVTQAGYTDSSVYDYGEHINFNVADIGTGNTTYCALDWPYYNATTSKYYGAPSGWNKCDDNTFSWKLDNWLVNPTTIAVSMEIKHQYKGAGKLCVKSNGPQCSTTLAAASKPYFILPNTGFQAPSGISGSENQFFLKIIDPNTSTGTNCSLMWDASNAAPSTWQNCIDKTFTWKFDYFSNLEFNLELKHQYTGDPLYVSLGVTGYAWYGCVLSGIGIAGSIKRSPTLLTIFSNHLLIDTVLSLVPKIGLLYLFSDLTKDLCFTPLSTTFWLPSETSSLHGPGRVIELSGQLSKSHQNCEIGLVCAQVVLLFILVLWTGAQWGLGLGIRRYALKLEMAELRAMPGDAEKMESFYEESLADGYHDAVRAVQEWTWPSKQGNEAATVIVVTEHKA
ncbi:hypothetical protein MBLNU459_g4980t2 [Dothideomycetes sp. NU459]